MSFTGNLKTVAFPDILQLLSTGKKTGILAITRGQIQKEVCFRSGNIIYAASKNDEDDFLGSLLLKRGRMSKTDLERALNLQKTSGKRLGMILVDMELFSREEIAGALKVQVEEIVYNLFSWDEGEFVFQEGKLPNVKDVLVELPTMSVIMEGTRRIDEWMAIQKALPRESDVLRINLNVKTKSDEVTLALEEFQVLSLVDGKRTLAEVVAASPVGEFVTYRGIHKLLTSGLIEALGPRIDTATDDPREEEQLWKLVLTLYTASFRAIRRCLERKLGPDNERVNETLAAYRKGVWAYFTGLGSSDFETNFANFYATIQRIPKETRLHKLLSGLHHILSEQLDFVHSMVGVNVLRNLESEIRKEITIPLAGKRNISKKYDVEADIFDVLKDSKKSITVRG